MSKAPVTVSHTVIAQRFNAMGLKVALTLLGLQRRQLVREYEQKLADIDKRIADTRAELKRAEATA